MTTTLTIDATINPRLAEHIGTTRNHFHSSAADPNATAFVLRLDGQEMQVRYYPNYFAAAGYARFEFVSPHSPRTRIPVSETGYRSHFSPMHEIEAAPSVEEYARVLVLAIIDAKQSANESEDQTQLALF